MTVRVLTSPNIQVMELTWLFKRKWASFKNQKFKNSLSLNFYENYWHMATLFSIAVWVKWYLLWDTVGIKFEILNKKALNRRCRNFKFLAPLKRSGWTQANELFNPCDILECSDCYQKPWWWGTHCPTIFECAMRFKVLGQLENMHWTFFAIFFEQSWKSCFHNVFIQKIWSIV